MSKTTKYCNNCMYIGNVECKNLTCPLCGFDRLSSPKVLSKDDIKTKKILSKRQYEWVEKIDIEKGGVKNVDDSIGLLIATGHDIDEKSEGRFVFKKTFYRYRPNNDKIKPIGGQYEVE